MLHIWICSCLFLSGACALIYEVAWLRVLGLTLGSTAYATSLALAVFLFGLALGAYVGGKLADTYPERPLMLYGAIEILIGGAALMASFLLVKVPGLILTSIMTSQADLGNSALGIGFCSCLILIVPTLFMGATLPVVLKQVAKYTMAQRTFGVIYGLNTLGAVFGSLAAAFLGFSYLGISGTITVAALINIAIGAANIHLARKDNLFASILDSGLQLQPVSQLY